MKTIRTGYNGGLLYGFVVSYEYINLRLLAHIYDLELGQVEFLWEEAKDYHNSNIDNTNDYLNFATDLEMLSGKKRGIMLHWPDDSSSDYGVIGIFTEWNAIQDIRKHVANRYDLDWTILNKNFQRQTKAQWYAVIATEN